MTLAVDTPPRDVAITAADAALHMRVVTETVRYLDECLSAGDDADKKRVAREGLQRRLKAANAAYADVLNDILAIF